MDLDGRRRGQCFNGAFTGKVRVSSRVALWLQRSLEMDQTGNDCALNVAMTRWEQMVRLGGRLGRARCSTLSSMQWNRCKPPGRLLGRMRNNSSLSEPLNGAMPVILRDGRSAHYPFEPSSTRRPATSQAKIVRSGGPTNHRYMPSETRIILHSQCVRKSCQADTESFLTSIFFVFLT